MDARSARHRPAPHTKRINPDQTCYVCQEPLWYILPGEGLSHSACALVCHTACESNFGHNEGTACLFCYPRGDIDKLTILEYQNFGSTQHGTSSIHPHHPAFPPSMAFGQGQQLPNVEFAGAGAQPSIRKNTVWAPDQWIWEQKPTMSPTPDAYSSPASLSPRPESGVFGDPLSVIRTILDQFWTGVRDWQGLSPDSVGDFVRYERIRVSKEWQLWQRVRCYLFTERLVFITRSQECSSTSQPYKLAGCIMLRRHVKAVERLEGHVLMLRLPLKELSTVYLKFASETEASNWFRDLQTIIKKRLV